MKKTSPVKNTEHVTPRRKKPTKVIEFPGVKPNKLTKEEQKVADMWRRFNEYQRTHPKYKDMFVPQHPERFYFVREYHVRAHWRARPARRPAMKTYHR